MSALHDGADMPRDRRGVAQWRDKAGMRGWGTLFLLNFGFE
jgi:hypothetical protein